MIAYRQLHESDDPYDPKFEWRISPNPSGTTTVGPLLPDKTASRGEPSPRTRPINNRVRSTKRYLRRNRAAPGIDRRGFFLRGTRDGVVLCAAYFLGAFFLERVSHAFPEAVHISGLTWFPI